MSEIETVIYETPDEGIARLVMNRPEVRNAQNLSMTYELQSAFDRALHDDQIKVIILAATDPHFSSGHDLRDKKQGLGKNYPVRSTWAGFEEPGIHGRFAREQEIYLQMIKRWRNLAKPTIAQVQGRCVAGGLMLAWACDLIVASDDAEFCDPVVALGVCGVEWFAHPWELGPRKAKELLWTGAAWSAEDARSLGMVNHVVPREELSSFTLDLAGRISSKPSFAVKLTKEAINKSVDLMGQADAIDYAYSLHQLCHSQNLLDHGSSLNPEGLHPSLRKK